LGRLRRRQSKEMRACVLLLFLTKVVEFNMVVRRTGVGQSAPRRY
jgi:hypothetical protein